MYRLCKWQVDIIDYLCKQRRYRILWWEFGPTLFNYLCKLKGFNDTELLQRKASNDEQVAEQCIKLLESWREVRAYWWWPWSSKISDIEINNRQKNRANNYESYFFLYRLVLVVFTPIKLHQNVIVFNKLIRTYESIVEESMPHSSSSSQHTINRHRANEHAPTHTNSVSTPPTNLVSPPSFMLPIESSINVIEKVKLAEALKLLNIRPDLLSNLSTSLDELRMMRIQHDDHEQLFNKEINKKFREMSRIHHTDRGSKDDTTQKAISVVWQAMKVIHQQCIWDKKLNYNMYANVVVNIINSSTYLPHVNTKIIRMLGKLWSIEDSCDRLIVERTAERRFTDYAKMIRILTFGTDYGEVVETLTADTDHKDMVKGLIPDEVDMSSKYQERYLSLFKEGVSEDKKNIQDTYCAFVERIKTCIEESKKDKDLTCMLDYLQGLLSYHEGQYKILEDYFYYSDCNGSRWMSSKYELQPYSTISKEQYEKAGKYTVLPVIECCNLLKACHEFSMKIYSEKYDEGYSKIKFWKWSCFSRNEEMSSESIAGMAEEVKKIVNENSFSIQDIHIISYYLTNYYCHNKCQDELKKFLTDRKGAGNTAEELLKCLNAGEFNQQVIKTVLCRILIVYEKCIRNVFGAELTIEKKKKQIEENTKRMMDELREEIKNYSKQVQEDIENLEAQMETQFEDLEAEVTTQLQKNIDNLETEMKIQNQVQLNTIIQLLNQRGINTEGVDLGSSNISSNPNLNVNAGINVGKDEDHKIVAAVLDKMVNQVVVRVDPSTAFDDVNVSQGASAGTSRN